MALTYGLLAAGVRHGAGYPITPGRRSWRLLRTELPKYGGIFVQAEDELAAISYALGFSYSGHLAVTGSSGPGLSLKMEALGWAIMAEMPLIVINVQRGGPSTGMPTNVEQSDLLQAIYGSHGDSPARRAGAANVEDCFYIALEAAPHRPRVQHPRRSSSPTRPSPPASRRSTSPISQADGRSQARPLGPGRRFQALSPRQAHPPRSARRPDRQRQVPDGHRPGARRTRPSDRQSRAAHEDDGQAPREAAGAWPRSFPCPKSTATRTARCFWSAGARPGARPRGGEPPPPAGRGPAQMHLRHLHPLPNGLEKSSAASPHRLSSR